MAESLSFDIFSGRFDTPNALWIEAVQGLVAAHERMQEIAATKPGEYFIFCCRTQAVVATTHTVAEAE